MNEFGFTTEKHEVWGEDAVVPLIDGTPLAEWVDIFETVADMQPSGDMSRRVSASVRSLGGTTASEGES